MRYNYSKLLGRIVEKGFTKESFAKQLSMNRTTLFKKLNSDSEFTQCEIMKAIDVLDINPFYISIYFFTPDV